MAIQFIDLCSGIGGFHSGLMATGHYECVGHAEIDPNAAKAYKAIYGEEGGLNYGDLREIDPKQLPDFELLCAGFPCQSFSVAGRRLGFQDTRGTVFFEIARIIAEKRPSFLLLENVPGLLSHDGGRTLTTIFSSLVEMGYHLEWMVLNSKYFGVPQQRRRLYIVGYLDARCAGKVFPLGSSYAKNLKQLIPGAQGQRVYETDGVACTQCASAGGWGGKTGLYFIDMNVNPKITEVARCITARQDSGVSNHRGEHSAVLIEDEPPRAKWIGNTRISFKPLFKLLIDRDIKKKDLAEMANISIATITKMGKDGSHVQSDVLERICLALGCKIGDIVQIIKIDEPEIEVAPEDNNEPVVLDSAACEEYGLDEADQEIVHFIYEQLKYYRERPPRFMVNQAQNEFGISSPQEAISRIPTDRFYSLVLNEVLEYWGQEGSSFAKKHIPFQLIESGYFEPEEQTFGEMKLT